MKFATLALSVPLWIIVANLNMGPTEKVSYFMAGVFAFMAVIAFFQED